MRSNKVAVVVLAAILLYMRCFRAHTVNTVGSCQDAAALAGAAKLQTDGSTTAVALLCRTALLGLATLMWPL